MRNWINIMDLEKVIKKRETSNNFEKDTSLKEVEKKIKGANRISF